MDLERLEAALRAAHAAGDTANAQRLAAEIRRLRAAGDTPKTPTATSPARSKVAEAADRRPAPLPPLDPSRNVRMPTPVKVPPRAPTPLEEEELRHMGVLPSTVRAPTPLEEDELRHMGVLPQPPASDSLIDRVTAPFRRPDPVMELPAVRVEPDPSRYGPGVVRRRDDGALLYDSSNVTSDGRRPTHLLTEIAPRLKPGQTVEEYERELVASAPSSGVPAVRSLDALQPDMRSALERMIADARAAGVNLSVGETDRPQARQDSLFALGRSGSGSPVTWTLTSNHAGGRAADLIADSPDGYRWIQQNAPRYGLGVLGNFDPGHVEMRAPRANNNALADLVDPGEASGAEGTWEPLTPREQGAVDARGKFTPLAAAAQTAGSMLFGIGTPLTAAEVYARSRLNDEREDLSWGESLEYARGRREELQSEHPLESVAGGLAALPSGVAMGRTALSAAPAVVRNALALREGSVVGNGLRLAATGATAGGVTALNEQGGEGVVPGAALGAVFGPAVAGAFAVGRAGASRVYGMVNRDDAAIRILARQLKEPIQNVVDRFNNFVRVTGRAPRLAEIVRTETAGELGAVGRMRPTAGQVLREAEEEAALQRPEQLAANVRNGRPGAATTTVAAQENLLPDPAEVGAGFSGGLRATASASARGLERTAQEAVAALEGNGVVAASAAQGKRGLETAAREVLTANPTHRSTETVQLSRRNSRMKSVMDQIENIGVPINAAMLKVLEGADVYMGLPATLRRRVAALVANKRTPKIPVRILDMVRKEMANKAGSGAGQIFSDYRDQIRAYVTRHVPQYGRILEEYGRRSDVAEGTAIGRRILTIDARELADILRTAGEGTTSVASRPAVRTATQAGVRIGARTAMVDALSGTPEEAGRFLTRLGRDLDLRNSLASVLNQNDLRRINKIASKYGVKLDFEAGVQSGRKLAAQGDEEAFVAAMQSRDKNAVAGGVRAVLANALSAGPQKAQSLMRRLAQDSGFRRRVISVLTDDEQIELTRLAERYGQQLDFGAGVKAGRQIATSGTTPSALAQQLRDSTPAAAGVRAGIRSTIARALEGTPEDAGRMMDRILRDTEYRSTVAAALSDDEAAQLERLAARSGRRMQLIEGAEIGSTVRAAKTEEFVTRAEGVAGAVAKSAGLRAGARSALTDAALESPASAVSTARSLAQDPGLRQRITAALGVEEAGRLQEVGDVTYTAARRMSEASPTGTFATNEAAERSNTLQKGIGAIVFAMGRASGAMIANVAKYMLDRLSLTEATAKRLAEMATDPNRAAEVIERLRASGLSTDEILRMYRDASIAAGITSGQEW